MTKLRFFVNALSIGVLIMAASAIASAQATRTWVSGVGDDANPCSRTAPCKTFAGAISKTAIGGEIDCLDPGGFGRSAININVASGNVNDPKRRVTIRHLTIQGVDQGSKGINVIAASMVFIERVSTRPLPRVALTCPLRTRTSRTVPPGSISRRRPASTWPALRRLESRR